MQVIEELLYQKTAQGLDWLFSVWWYWLPAGIGFLFRFGLLKCKIWDSVMRIILTFVYIFYGLAESC